MSGCDEIIKKKESIKEEGSVCKIMKKESTGEDESVQESADNNESVQESADDNETVQERTEEVDSVCKVMEQESTEEDESVQERSEEDESVQERSEEDESVQERSEEDESVQERSEEDESLQERSEEDESVQESTENDESVQERTDETDSVCNVMEQERREEDDSVCKVMEQERTEEYDSVYKSLAKESMLEDDYVHELREANSQSRIEISMAKTCKSENRRSKATPARRSRSAACCCSLVTPTLTRLRPRTPCSRSTRRSLSVHCDLPADIFTPRKHTSTRKSSRRSVNAKMNNIHEQQTETDTVKISFIDATDVNIMMKDSEVITAVDTMESLREDNIAGAEVEDKIVPSPVARSDEVVQEEPKTPIENETSSTDASQLLITPISNNRRSKVSRLIQSSPWIDSSRRSEKKKAHLRVTPDFQDLGNVLVDGLGLAPQVTPDVLNSKKLRVSQIVGDPVATDSPIAADGEDKTCRNILALLEPSVGEQDTDSPGINVWGEDSPAVTSLVGASVKDTYPVGPEKVTRTETPVSTSSLAPSHHEKPKRPSEADAKTGSIMPVDLNSTNSDFEKNDKKLLHKTPPSKKARKSVMFSAEEKENEEMPSFRFPGTPVRASSRASMGLFAKMDMSTDFLPAQAQDLMSMDSPMSERKTASTGTKALNVSLLGMMSSPAPENSSPITHDLISWETPVAPRRKSSRNSTVSSYTTPCRRSKRLSKAPVL